MEHPTFYRCFAIDGLPIFYRAVGPRDVPMHGLRCSSRMIEALLVQEAVADLVVHNEDLRANRTPRRAFGDCGKGGFHAL
jgi:hypothetical protein